MFASVRLNLSSESVLRLFWNTLLRITAELPTVPHLNCVVYTDCLHADVTIFIFGAVLIGSVLL